MHFKGELIMPIDVSRHHPMLMLVSKVLKEYAVAGKFLEDFEKDFGCTITFNEFDEFSGITGVLFHNVSNETMFMLKYNT